MAADQLKDTVFEGIQLAEAARFLVAKRMIYWRRNSFDNYTRAFERGYGAYRQHAYALADLLNKLGFEAKVVAPFAIASRTGKCLVTPETFHVTERAGPLYRGELERAENWTNSILAAVVWPGF